jgi:hypothetical protein
MVPVGEHTARWDRRNDGGARLGAGIYFAELSVAGRKASSRIVLL